MFRYAPRGLIAHYTIPTNQSEPGAALPFSLNQTGTLLPRHLAQFVSAIDNQNLLASIAEALRKEL